MLKFSMDFSYKNIEVAEYSRMFGSKNYESENDKFGFFERWHNLISVVHEE